MSTQHNNSNFYLFLAIIAILYHVNSTETSVKDIHKILAHQRLVEPTVEKHQSLAQVSDIIGRFDNFEKAITQLPEVLECLIVTGQSADFLLKIVVRDMQHYEKFLLGHLTRLAGVTGVHSSFVLREVMKKTELPLD